MNKKIILIILGIVLVLCCVVSILVMLMFKDQIMKVIYPTVTPTPTVTTSFTLTPTPDISGNWSGSYIVNDPSACVGTGTWDATLIQQNGVITGTYTSDIGLGGNVNGTITGADFNWSVSGGGGVSFTGSLANDLANGNFTGPVCTGSIHTTGTFTGNKQ